MAAAASRVDAETAQQLGASDSSLWTRPLHAVGSLVFDNLNYETPPGSIGLAVLSTLSVAFICAALVLGIDFYPFAYMTLVCGMANEIQPARGFRHSWPGTVIAGGGGVMYVWRSSRLSGFADKESEMVLSLALGVCCLALATSIAVESRSYVRPRRGASSDMRPSYGLGRLSRKKNR